MSPFARPGFPGFVGAPAGNAYGTLGGLAGLSANSAAGLFASRGDLGAGCLGQDPWARLHRGAPFGPLGGGAPPPQAGGGGQPGAGGGAWGGLKAEADRERLEQQQHEGEKQRRLEAAAAAAAAADKERKKRELDAALEKAKEMEREMKAQEERQRERDRENRLHLHHNLSEGILRNGDYMDARATSNSHHQLMRDREPHSRPTEWSLREPPTRSPARAPKVEGPFEPPAPPKVEVRVKEERREPDEPERKRPAPPPAAAPPAAAPPVPSSDDFRNAHFLSLGAAERAAFWNAAAAAAAPPLGGPGGDPYRTLLDFRHPATRSELDREHYRLLNPMVAFHDRFRDISELDRMALERELQSKLAAPPLRPTDPAAFSSLFSQLGPPSPYLGGLAGLAASSRAGAKNGPTSAAPPGSRPEGAVPPPLIPCGSGGGAGGPNNGPPPHGLSSLNHKMGPLVDHGAHHDMALYAKERRELANHKAEGQLR